MLDTDEHLAVNVAWLIYQKIITAYANANRRRGKQAMSSINVKCPGSVPPSALLCGRLPGYRAEGRRGPPQPGDFKWCRDQLTSVDRIE